MIHHRNSKGKEDADEYKNNVSLMQVPQPCDKIRKSAKGIEKGKIKVNVSQAKS